MWRGARCAAALILLARTCVRAEEAAAVTTHRITPAAVFAPRAAPTGAHGGDERTSPLQWDALSPPPADAAAGVGRSASGSAPSAPTTCSVDGGALQAGGAFNRVEVYNTAGGTRSFFLVLPLGYNAQGAAPRTLLITLHGGIIMGDVQMRDHQFDTKGIAAGFVVAAPNALNAEWNLHNEANDGPPDLRPDVDEIAFMGDMVTCIAALGVPLTRKAVLSGYSLGGMFACRIACSPPPGLTIAAVATAGGIQSEVAQRACVGAPMLLFQGGEDTQTPLCKRATLWDTVFVADLAYDALQPKLDDWIRYNGGDIAVMAPTMCARAEDGSDDSDTEVFSWPGRAGVITVMFWSPTGIHWWPRRLTGCGPHNGMDSVDVAIAFYQSALAGNALAVPPMCGGLAPCVRKLPCDAPATETWVSSW